MSRLIVTADYSCEFSQRHGPFIDTDGGRKKKSESCRVPAIFGSTLRLAGANELTGTAQCRRVSRWLIGSSVALYIYGERGRTRSGNGYEDR